jgi:hypothetical protein
LAEVGDDLEDGEIRALQVVEDGSWRLLARAIEHVRAKPFQATRCDIPARAFVIRFPDGDFEYDLTRNDYPEVGDVLRRRGSLWSVIGIEGDVQFTVHVAPTDGQDVQRQVTSTAE